MIAMRRIHHILALQLRICAWKHCCDIRAGDLMESAYRVKPNRHRERKTLRFGILGILQYPARVKYFETSGMGI